MFAIVLPPIDPVAVEIGPLAVRWYALAYLVGFIGGWRYCIHLARRTGLPPRPHDLDDFVAWAVIGVILGGRLGFVLFYNLPYYLENPLEILMVWQGGMSFHGGLLGIVGAILLFSHVRGFSPWYLGDLVAVVAPIGLFLGRMANFVNAELYGRATDVPWAMVFPTDQERLPRHPSQLYEAFLEGIVLFVLLAVLARRESVRRRPGLLAGLFLIGYGIARSLVEFVRQYGPMYGVVIPGVTMGQLLSVPMILAGLWIVWRANPYRAA
jgi:phosphatidylglycerol:prolipoprotein diacylglycerol transferase